MVKYHTDSYLYFFYSKCKILTSFSGITLNTNLPHPGILVKLKLPYAGYEGA